tara:strand:- start:1309 stop:1695 length:387 start_codon:yes stop_codon:yes gene_type:complete
MSAIFEVETTTSMSLDKTLNAQVSIDGDLEGEDTDSDYSSVALRFCWEEEVEVQVEVSEGDIINLDHYDLGELLEAITLNGELEKAIQALSEEARGIYMSAGLRPNLVEFVAFICDEDNEEVCNPATS